jgi:hypothetical protein
LQQDLEMQCLEWFAPYYWFLQQNSLKSIRNYSFGPQSLLKFLFIYWFNQQEEEFNNLESLNFVTTT